MDGAKDDKQQIGLTEDANAAIVGIANDYFGGSQLDAYRFAMAYAIGEGLDPDTAPQGGYVTKYSALGTVESGTTVRDLLRILKIGDQSRPFATAEKLAEIGIRALSHRLNEHETIADLLAEVCGDGSSHSSAGV